MDSHKMKFSIEKNPISTILFSLTFDLNSGINNFDVVYFVNDYLQVFGGLKADFFWPTKENPDTWVGKFNFGLQTILKKTVLFKIGGVYVYGGGPKEGLRPTVLLGLLF